MEALNNYSNKNILIIRYFTAKLGIKQGVGEDEMGKISCGIRNERGEKLMDY